MPATFTNAHSHIFTANHAPDYFLKTAIPITWLAEWVDRFLKRGHTRWAIRGILKFFALLSPGRRDIIRRYLEFVQIGTSASQSNIFDQLNRVYAQFQGHRIVVLTQVLDYLDLRDNTSGHVRIAAQVEEVRTIKRNAAFRDYIYPFLGVDPRQSGLNLLDNWVRVYIRPDNGFYGIKIYPAAGFFPFDERLDPVWAWAEANGVPVMTHATRGGSFYLGSFQSLLNSGSLQLPQLDPAVELDKRILDRVASLVEDSSVHKKNVVWCNIFGFPDNYEVVLRKFPRLKICLAHLGGSSEVNRSDKPDSASSYPKYMNRNWYTLILEMMRKYPNVYSDISYTLSDMKSLGIIYQRFEKDDTINKRLMYGTDFYLTQQEKLGDEPDLQQNFLKYFPGKLGKLLAYENPAGYLQSEIWPGENRYEG